MRPDDSNRSLFGKDRHHPLRGTIENQVLKQMLPKGAWMPLVFDVPNCGREYPNDFGSILSEDKLRQDEDAYVDESIADAPELGSPVLAARYSRTYLDLN